MTNDCYYHHIEPGRRIVSSYSMTPSARIAVTLECRSAGLLRPPRPVHIASSRLEAPS